MCSALQVSTSGFYAWQRHVPSEHEKKDIRLKVLIRESFDKSRKTYGSPRVLVDLADEKVGRNRIIRLMQLEGIVARVRRRYRSTTMSDHDQPIAANVLNREFDEATAPNQRWVGDTTEMLTTSGIGFVRSRFWPGRHFVDLLDLNTQAARWRDDIANNRVHEETGKVPALVFRHEEKRHLKPISDAAFDVDDVETSTVTKTFRVTFDRNRYSVPWRLTSQTVLVRADDDTVAIFLGRKQVAVHPRSWKAGEDIEHPSHREGLLQQKPRAWYYDPLGLPLHRYRLAISLVESRVPDLKLCRRISRVPCFSVDACCAPYPAGIFNDRFGPLRRGCCLRRDMSGWLPCCESVEAASFTSCCGPRPCLPVFPGS